MPELTEYVHGLVDKVYAYFDSVQRRPDGSPYRLHDAIREVVAGELQSDKDRPLLMEWLSHYFDQSALADYAMPFPLISIKGEVVSGLHFRPEQVVEFLSDDSCCRFLMFMVADDHEKSYSALVEDEARVELASSH